MLDGIGERYGLLPSQVVAQADTFDIMVFDVVNTWKNQQHAKAQGGVAPANLPDSVMKEMLATVKRTKNERKNNQQNNS